ncbi:MAG: interleukin-like EMT inducer domain-containing protein [Eubacteriales bacterium]
MKKVMTVIFFGIGLSVFLYGFNVIFKPLLYPSNPEYLCTSFYDIPTDTLETVFIGSSHTQCSIIPMELYKNQGISSTNLATPGQSVAVSYYWIIEAYKHHSDTLQTIVLNTSMLRAGAYTLEEEYYKYAIMNMKGINKQNIIKIYADNLDAFVENNSNIFGYHYGWKIIKKYNFFEFDFDSYTNLRGYCYNKTDLITSNKYTELYIPNYQLMNSSNENELTEEILSNGALEYLNMIVEFCENNKLELILTQTPVEYWTDDLHTAIQEIALENDIDFLDFNYYPLIDDIELCVAIDQMDTGHLNYYGAIKFTDWMGEYLISEYGATDIRENPDYSFMEEEWEVYVKTVISAKLEEITELGEYISYVNEIGNNYSILITVKDEAAGALTKDQKDRFAEIGLEQLSELEYRESYIGVLEGGATIYENTQEWINREEVESEEALYIEYESVLPDGTEYILQSGGYQYGNVSSCIIDGTEYSLNQRGLNIVVYDNELGEVVDVANFDTCVESERISGNTEDALEKMLEDGMAVDELTGVYKELYLYNVRCQDEYTVKELDVEIGDTGMYQYLETFWGEEQYVIILSVQDEASDSLDEVSRKAFENWNLVELSTLEYRDSYIAIVDGGNILVEEKNHEADPIKESILNSSVTSGGNESGNISSIKIDGVEYSQNTRGVNIVIYNKETELVVDSRTFDTYQYTVTIE